MAYTGKLALDDMFGLQDDATCQAQRIAVVYSNDVLPFNLKGDDRTGPGLAALKGAVRSEMPQHSLDPTPFDLQGWRG